MSTPTQGDKRRDGDTGGFEAWIDVARESGTEVDTRRVRMLCGSHRDARLEWNLMSDFDRVRDPRPGDEAAAASAVDAIMMLRTGTRMRASQDRARSERSTPTASAVDTPARPTPALNLERKRGPSRAFQLGAGLSALLVGVLLGAAATSLRAGSGEQADAIVGAAPEPVFVVSSSPPAPLEPRAGALGASDAHTDPGASALPSPSAPFPTAEQLERARPAARVDALQAEVVAPPEAMSPQERAAAAQLAAAYVAIDRHRGAAARRILSRLVRRYPGTPQALEARVIVGELSMARSPRLSARAFQRALDEGAEGEARARALHGLADLAARRGDSSAARRLRRSVAGR